MQPKKPPHKPPSRAKKGNLRAAEFAAFFGKTGSGKSYAMLKYHEEMQRKDRRQVIAWSPKERHDNYARVLRCKAYASMPDFVRAVRTGADAVFIPTLDRAAAEPLFDLFCRLAFAIAPVAVLIEELHTVTRPTGGVPMWHQVTTMGRGDGIRVLAASQRPAHVDKDFFGALSYVHCGAMLYEEDAKTAANLVLCHRSEIMALSGYQSKTRTM